MYGTNCDRRRIAGSAIATTTTDANAAEKRLSGVGGESLLPVARVALEPGPGTASQRPLLKVEAMGERPMRHQE